MPGISWVWIFSALSSVILLHIFAEVFPRDFFGHNQAFIVLSIFFEIDASKLSGLGPCFRIPRHEPDRNKGLAAITTSHVAGAVSSPDHSDV